MGTNEAKGKGYKFIILKLVVAIITFIISVQWLVISFELLNENFVETILIASSNPFVALFIGLLFTAMVQSSSTTTTLVVAIVASGTLRLEDAVFMIMGANIGTTLTSTLISLGHINSKKEFRKAIAAATLHDFFNILTALVLLPLEYYFQLLSSLARGVTSLITWNGSVHTFKYLDFTHPLLRLFSDDTMNFLRTYDLVILALTILTLFASLKFISQSFKTILLDRFPNRLEKQLFRSPVRAVLVGGILTGFLQSSTLISSLIVPIVASNKLSIKRAFPFLMGANVGTTLTALVAAISQSDAAISLAMTHFLFNVIGVLIFLPFKRLRNIPIQISRKLGKATVKNRFVGFAYVLLTFFIVPFFLIYFSKGNVHIRQYEFHHESKHPMESSRMGGKSLRPRKILYKENNFATDWESQVSYQSVIKVNRQGDTIFVNDQRFLLGRQGDCWDYRDTLGNYTICLEPEKKNSN